MRSQLTLKLIAIFMLLSGLAFAIDLTLVLCGYVIPVSYPEFDMSWNNSPIFHYNVSPAANTIIGMLAAMALYVGLFLVTQFRTVKKRRNDFDWQMKSDLRTPIKEQPKVKQWLKDQLN